MRYRETLLQLYQPTPKHHITSQHHPHAKKDLLCLAWHSATPPPLINLEFTYQKQGKEEEEKQGGQPGQSIFHLVLANSEHLSQAHRLAGVPGWAFNTLRPMCLLPAITIIFFTVLSPCFSAPIPTIIIALPFLWLCRKEIGGANL